jgi:acyl-CoA reductase-like NAD-dependent aldehyde dehydrogenase
VLHRLADLIDSNIADLAIVECVDMAMLLESLEARVIHRGAENFRNYADLASAYTERVWSSKGTVNRVIRMPAGPAVIITPWNAPWILSTWKIAPALAAGNTVVLKPAEWAPLSASLLADLAEEAGMPPGVLNVVQGIGEEVGAALVGDRRARRISLTGSPETARHIGEAAALNIVPFTGELGGKGPFMVFADADLDAAARKAAVMYDDAGQVCLAGTRLLVEESIGPEFLELFRAYTEKHVLGDSRSPGTTISPLIHPDHLHRVEGFVERARDAGDRIVWGGERWKQDGLWYLPTLIEPKSNHSEVVQQEIFGPVLTYQTFSDEGQAVELANSTRVRALRNHLHRFRGAGQPGGRSSPCRHGVGEQLPGPGPDRAVRRDRDIRYREGRRRLRPRLPLRPEDPPDRREHFVPPWRWGDRTDLVRARGCRCEAATGFARRLVE